MVRLENSFVDKTKITSESNSFSDLHNEVISSSSEKKNTLSNELRFLERLIIEQYTKKNAERAKERDVRVHDILVSSKKSLLSLNSKISSQSKESQGVNEELAIYRYKPLEFTSLAQKFGSQPVLRLIHTMSKSLDISQPADKGRIDAIIRLCFTSPDFIVKNFLI